MRPQPKQVRHERRRLVQPLVSDHHVARGMLRRIVGGGLRPALRRRPLRVAHVQWIVISVGVVGQCAPPGQVLPQDSLSPLGHGLLTLYRQMLSVSRENAFDLVFVRMPVRTVEEFVVILVLECMENAIFEGD